jgi:hypothetical protein
MKKLIKQILFLFCILVNVTLFISLVDILKGVLNDKPESYVIGLPCTYNVIISVSLLLFGSLVTTYVLLKDDSFG